MKISEMLEALKGGGFTNWITPESKTGYLVAGACPAIVRESVHEVTKTDIIDLIVRADDIADAIGGWVDEEDGKAYLDGNTWIPDLETALKVARERGELAVWDIARGVSVYVR